MLNVLPGTLVVPTINHTSHQCWFNFNIIDFISNCHLQCRNIVAKFKSQYWMMVLNKTNLVVMMTVTPCTWIYHFHLRRCWEREEGCKTHLFRGIHCILNGRKNRSDYKKSLIKSISSCPLTCIWRITLILPLEISTWV